MNTAELTMLLARIQVLDNRQIDQLTIEAWTPLMAHTGYADAVEAVNAHFQESTDYLKPAHIIRRVRDMRRLELPATMSPPAPDTCTTRAHRWLPDNTCMHCTERRQEP